jgi:hypothetical protein
LDLNQFHVGDRLVLLWDITPEMKTAINRQAWGDSYFRPRVFQSTRVNDEKVSVKIPFTVVSRSHDASEQKDHYAELKYLGFSVTVEAETWQWEDLWKWIILGTVPVWAED